MPTRLNRYWNRLSRLVGGRPAATAVAGGEVGHDWYDSVYRTSDEYRLGYTESRYYFVWTVIVDRVRRGGFKRVFEVGCGAGQLASFVLDQAAVEYGGLDFSPVAVEKARANAPSAAFVVADARSPEAFAQAGEYDVLICTEVLEHIEDDLAVVGNFRPGARCICTVPNFPYESHVRHFTSTAEVAARYARFFDGFDVCGLRSPGAGGQVYYIFDGVRNQVRA